MPRRADGPELAERLEVTVRTLRRDIARVRELGYPGQATVGVADGYRLGAGSTLPGTGIIEATDPDSCLLTIGADSLPQMVMHLALLGHDFTVHEPAELGRLPDRLNRAHRALTR